MSSDRYTTLCTEKNLKNLVYRPTEADILKARQKAARRTQLTESRDVEAKKREEEAKIQGVRVAMELAEKEALDKEKSGFLSAGRNYISEIGNLLKEEILLDDQEDDISKLFTDSRECLRGLHRFASGDDEGSRSIFLKLQELSDKLLEESKCNAMRWVNGISSPQVNDLSPFIEQIPTVKKKSPKSIGPKTSIQITRVLMTSPKTVWGSLTRFVKHVMMRVNNNMSRRKQQQDQVKGYLDANGTSTTASVSFPVSVTSVSSSTSNNSSNNRPRPQSEIMKEVIDHLAKVNLGIDEVLAGSGVGREDSEFVCCVTNPERVGKLEYFSDSRRECKGGIAPKDHLSLEESLLFRNLTTKKFLSSAYGNSAQSNVGLGNPKKESYKISEPTETEVVL